MTVVASRRNAVRAVGSLALVSFLLAGCATTGPDGSSREATDLAETAGTGLASVLASALYAPAKIVYAITGAVVGGGAYVVSGGNAEVANAVIGPAVGGHYVVTPERLRNPKTLEFVGTGYDVMRRGEDAASEAPPAVAAAPPSACASLGAYPNVFFKSGETTLDASATKSLDQAAGVLHECPRASAEIRAFSDALGSRAANLALSQKRAQVVRDYLLDRGIADDRLRLMTFGEDNPVAVNATKAGRAANRRVELTLR